ncbi:MAG: hypothetical protein E6K54_02025 [Gammaproteobacteria bacterium]|nr:MAG: hypothetical protein E6K54_02025 [Gammaproteobacteria bacterium]
MNYVASISKEDLLQDKQHLKSTIYLKKVGGFHQIFASDGDFFDECIGSYNINDSTSIRFDNEKLSYWLMTGAIPTLEVINIIITYLEIKEVSGVDTIINKLKPIKN